MHYGLAAQRRAHSVGFQEQVASTLRITIYQSTQKHALRSALCPLRLPLTLLIDIAILSKKSNSKRGYGSGQLQRL